jgi:hypothetical protein
MMTEDRARKKAIRARMAASGEQYSVAARHHAEGQRPDDDAALSEIIACAVRTLAAPGARMAYGHEWQNLPSLSEMAPAVRLVGAAVRTVWRRIAPDRDLRRGRAEGFAEPAAGRYMIDHGGLSEVCIGGTTFTGLSGRALAALRPDAADHESGDALWSLRLVPGVTEAAFEAAETLHDTACRRFAVRVDTARAATASPVKLRVPHGASPRPGPSLALIVWIGRQYVHQVRLRQGASGAPPDQASAGLTKVLTLELWDFGVPTEHLDWSRLPNFRDPS